MKNGKLRQLFCGILAIMLVMSMAACRKSEDYDSVYSYVTEIVETTSKVESDISADANDSKINAQTSNPSTTTSNSSSSNKKPVIQDDNATNLSRDQVIKAMPEKLKGTTITYMYWNDPRKQMDNTAIKAFEKATGCNVECIVASYQGFQEELASRITSGKAPDLVRLLGNVSWQITSLQPIANSGFDFNDKAWDSQVMKDFTFNGNCYAVNLKDSAISDVAVMYYNKIALENAEMEDPYTIWKKNPKNWTWEKFWSMCDEFMKANKGKVGYAGATFEYTDIYPRAMGGTIYHYDSSKYQFVNNCKSSATVDAWKKNVEMMDKGLLLKSHDVNSFDQAKTLFFCSGPFSARRMDSRQSKLKEQKKLGVVPMPVDSKYQVMYEYTAFGIPKGAPNAAAVPYYLRYVLDKKSYNMNNVYYSEEAKEVVEYACQLTNRIYGYAAGTANVTGTMISSGSNNVKSILDQNYDAVDEFVANENARISTYE